MRKFIFYSVFLIFLSCGRNIYFYDFFYNFDEKNIKESPYIELYREMKIYKEILMEWKLYKDFKDRNLRIWFSSTSFPVLNIYEKELQRKLSLYFGKSNLKYIPFEDFMNSSTPLSWSVKRESYTLSMKSPKQKFNELLPGGKTVIEMEDGKGEVRINQKKMGGYLKRGVYSVYFLSNLGMNIIEMESLLEDIKSLRIKSNKNLVFLCLPSEIKPGPASISCTTIPSKASISVDRARFLLEMRNKDLSGEQQKNSTWGLVKKLSFYDQTWSSLFAPPYSVFEFPAIISPNSVLEFGYFVKPFIKSRDYISFSIYFVSGRNKKLIFKKKVFYTEEPDIFLEKIEIGKFVKGKGKLLFITSNKFGTPALVAWITPHLYIKRDQKKIIGIILISLDSLRRDFVGVYSKNKAITPEMDKLAENSVIFENAYAQSSWTLPSHVSILSGLFPVEHGTNTLQNKIPDSVKTLPQILKKQGFIAYAYTGGGLVSSQFGFSKGFDHYKEWDGMMLPDSSKPIFERARDFLSRHKGKNFFLFLHTMQFHDPLESPEEVRNEVLKGNLIWNAISLSEELKGRDKLLSKEELENIKLLYKAEARTIDKHLIGPLIHKLKEDGFYDQTMIIITSDHGEEIMEHGGLQHGHSLYNEQIRVPLLIKFPYSEFKGKRVYKNVRHVDLAPTILEVAGINPSKYKMDGKSLTPLIKDKKDKERECFSEIYYQEERPRIPPQLALVYGDFKLLIKSNPNNMELPSYELYDIREDPMEKFNLFERRKELFDFMMEMVREYTKRKPLSREKVVIGEELKSKLKTLGYIE